MKVADYVIRKLSDEGIQEVHMVYGAAIGNLVDAFTRITTIKYICYMHEAVAGNAAEGSAKISNNFGVAMATSGPGAQNLVTPIANCYYDSVPSLFLTGQVKTTFMRPDATIRQIGFQETDIIAIVQPVTKYAKCVMNPQEIRYELEKALFIMKDGRPGPVLLDLPIDVQQAEIDWEQLKAFDSAGPVTPYDCQEDCLTLLEDIRKCERPAILVGGGAKNAIFFIKTIAEQLNIPVFRTWNAKDLVANDFTHFAGDVGTYAGVGRNFGIQNCDLLICFGTRISGRITGGNPSSFARGAKKWIIDIDPSNQASLKSQGIIVDQFIEAPAEVIALHLEKMVKGERSPSMIPEFMLKFSEWTTRCINWRNQYDPVLLHPLTPDYPFVNPYHFIRELSNQCRPNDILVSECGGNQVIFAHAFKTKEGQRCISNHGNSSMGQGLGLAIGAYFAEPKRQVIALLGDGGMCVNSQELQTVRYYNMPIKIIIINNFCYGITLAYQRDNFNGRQEACCPEKGYTPPSFAKLAEAYNIPYMSIKDNAWLAVKIKDFMNHKGPVIFDVQCNNWCSYFPKLTGWRAPIEDMTPYLSRMEFLNNMIVDPLDGWREHDYK